MQFQPQQPQNTEHPQWQHTPQQEMPPQQPYPQYQPPKKQGNKFIWLWIVVALFIGIGIGYGIHTPGNATPNTSVATIQATGQPSQQAQPTQALATATPAPFTVGKQVDVGYWNVSVNSAKTHQGDDVSPLKSGDTFLAIDVTVTNISGSSQLMANNSYFRITDSTGQTARYFTLERGFTGFV